MNYTAETQRSQRTPQRRIFLLCVLCASAVQFVISLHAADPYRPVGFVELPVNVSIGATSAVAVDSRGGVYVLHRGDPPILLFDAAGRYQRGFGSGLFRVAHGLRIDHEGNVWTTDNGNHVVRMFSAAGRLLRTLGEEDVAGADESHFRAPDDLVFGSNGEIYVADSGNGRIVKLSRDGKYVSAWGRKGKGAGEFSTAHGLAIDSRDRIYVADRGNHRVQIFDPAGKFLDQWDGFGNPFGLLVVGDQLLVAEGEIHKVFHLDSMGALVASWGGPEVLKLPHFMAAGRDGTLYVAEVDGKRIQKFHLSGAAPAKVGGRTHPPRGDAP